MSQIVRASKKETRNVRQEQDVERERMNCTYDCVIGLVHLDVGKVLHVDNEYSKNMHACSISFYNFPETSIIT